jgi:chromosome partitioning protein
MQTLRLSQISDLVGLKRHTLNARIHSIFDKTELDRSKGNNIILNSGQIRRLIDDRTIHEPGKVIYIGNLKGGVGKTTLSYLLSDSLSTLGIKTCIIDLDVQANLTNQYINISPEQPVFFDLIDGKKRISDIILKINDTLSIVPSSLRNSLIEKALTLQTPKHYLSWFNSLCLDYLRKQYDVILVDTPPSLSTLNSVFCLALKPTDSIVVPVCPEEFSMMGVQMFLNDVNEIRTSYSINEDPQTIIVMNKFFQNQKTNLEVLMKMGNLFGDLFCDAVIKDSAKLREIINDKIRISDIKSGKEIYQTLNELLAKLNIIESKEQ